MDKLEEAKVEELAGALTDLQAIIGKINTEHGFRDYSDTVTEPEQLARSQANALMLIVGEVAEAHEELRKGHAASHEYYSGGFDMQGAPDFEPYDRAGKPRKPEGVPSEIADVVIRCLDFADNFGIDLGAIVAEKIAYNATRPFKHGKSF